MNEVISQLILVVTASYKGAVGFGDIFDCQIKRVLAGTMPEPRISLSILANDKENLKFVSTHLHPAEIEIGFKIIQKDEPYNFAPISGFVDKTKTSWGIEFIHEAR